MSQLDKLLDKITKKVDQVEKLHDKESLLCEEVKDLIEEIRENHVEEDHTWEEDDDNLEEDFDEVMMHLKKQEYFKLLKNDWGNNNKKNYRSFYTKKTKETIKDMFQWEILNFNYKF